MGFAVAPSAVVLFPVVLLYSRSVTYWKKLTILKLTVITTIDRIVIYSIYMSTYLYEISEIYLYDIS
jgi:hypothetical protein